MNVYDIIKLRKWEEGAVHPLNCMEVEPVVENILDFLMHDWYWILGGLLR